MIQRFYLILFSHLEKQKRAWKKLNPDYITAENAESAEKTVILQRSLSITPLERSEKDIVLPKRNSGSEAKRTSCCCTCSATPRNLRFSV